MTTWKLHHHRLTVPSGILAVLTVASTVGAQPAPAPAQPPATPPGTELGPGQEAVKDKVDELAAALAPEPGGLTLEAVGREAIATSNAVKGKEAELAGAQGQVATTVVNFFPRLTLS